MFIPHFIMFYIGEKLLKVSISPSKYPFPQSLSVALLQRSSATWFHTDGPHTLGITSYPRKKKKAKPT